MQWLKFPTISQNIEIRQLCFTAYKEITFGADHNVFLKITCYCVAVLAFNSAQQTNIFVKYH